MPLSYSARLRRDLRDWQERGLIQPEQAERIAAHALAPRGLRHFQTALALCILLLVAPSIIAFVTANWSTMSPSARLIVLFLANAAAVSATYLASRRVARDQAGSIRRLVDGLATLSLAIAAATLALVGQTFHVAADPHGFAETIAVLGLSTALVTRSGGGGPHRLHCAHRNRRGPGWARPCPDAGRSRLRIGVLVLDGGAGAVPRKPVGLAAGANIASSHTRSDASRGQAQERSHRAAISMPARAVGLRPGVPFIFGSRSMPRASTGQPRCCSSFRQVTFHSSRAT